MLAFERAYGPIDPAARLERYLAMLCALMFNLFTDPKKVARKDIDEFVLRFGELDGLDEDDEPDVQGVESMVAIARAWTEHLGGTDRSDEDTAVAEPRTDGAG